MRVIAGASRGRRLAAPRGHGTRPTPARVREALFSILAGEIEDAEVLDLFAGTGALGIEALSRGARSATFVEKDRSCLAALRHNLELLPPGAANLLAMPAARAVSLLSQRRQRFDLAFLDPPFDSDLLAATLPQLVSGGLLDAAGVIICEHRGRSEPPPAPAAWHRSRTRQFGDVALSFYHCEHSLPQQPER